MSTRFSALAAAALLAAFTLHCAAAPADPPAAAPAKATGHPIVVQNYYYARPGKAEEVYRWRLHASQVRARLGLPVGRVLLRQPPTGAAETDGDLPDVVWECEYADASAREADLARLTASGEFEAVEQHMQTLIRGFRRAVFSVSPDR